MGKDNEIKIMDPINKVSKASELCVKEVNEIMKKYNCEFTVQTILQDGVVVHNQVYIIERKK